MDRVIPDKLHSDSCVPRCDVVLHSAMIWCSQRSALGRPLFLLYTADFTVIAHGQSILVHSYTSSSAVDGPTTAAKLLQFLWDVF